MNNIELEQKVLEIIAEDNYFEMIMKAIAFEKEYKTSDFYKATKKPLIEMIKEAKVYYVFQLKDMSNKLQKMINNLDLTKINEILDQVSRMFSTENEDIQKTLEAIKDLQS